MVAAISLDERDAHKVREEHLRVLQSRHEKLVEWTFELALVHLSLITEQISVYLDLHSE